ncbi:MAG TPA: SUMF1/EgtB/PvdO family nonheme iron enzyme, partial [Ktedonobacterales bacterium]|nr:SUMF1/EgtB/PvdO family nonheme iron enzyme [Ktedonobacterales bacterium]
VAFDELAAALRAAAPRDSRALAAGAAAPTPQPAPPSAAPTADPRAAQLRRLVDDAGAALAAGHFGDAVLKAELALTLPGGNTAEVRALLARAAAGSGRWQPARDAATRALSDDAFNIPLWRLLAEAHHHLNAPAEALTALDRAQALTPLSDTPTRLAILSERRAIQSEQQQWPAALATIEDELRLAPDDPARLETLADLQAKTNHPQDAQDTLRRLTARPNARAAAWLARARFALAAHDARDAQTALDAAAHLMPNAATDPALAALRAQLDELLLPIPRNRFPQRLTDLGFSARQERDVAYILPPLCPVPAGPFLMGEDKQQHTITLPAYQIARYPLTVAEYACFVRAGHNAPEKGAYGIDWNTQLQRLEHPVTSVTWHDAVAYAAWLAQQTGQPWRLPSEAEWEKAARGTDGRLYPWGNTFDAARANTSESGKRATTPVGTYPTGASPYGAGDLAGNVWEWTTTIFKPYPYRQNDGREDLKSTDNRVPRGGSWSNGSTYARAAYRGHLRPGNRNDGIGFRVALAAPGSAH